MSYDLLKGKRGLIFGALNDKSIAWKVAERAREEGAKLVLTNTPVSIRMGTIDELAERCGAVVIPADATNVEDLENLVTKGMEHLGGKFDFVLHSIGMSPNVRKGRTYDDLDYDYYHKTVDISAISFHKVIQTCRKFDAIEEWGSVVALSYIAAQRTLYGYNDMADAKGMSPLGNATAAECADYIITLFSDLTRKVTMQNLYHDGGYSSMGMSMQAMHIYNEGLEYRDVKNDKSRRK